MCGGAPGRRRVWPRDHPASPRPTSVDHQPERGERKLNAQAARDFHTAPGKSLYPHLPGPLPADAATLADALTPRELAAEPAYPRILAGSVIGLVTSQCLSREQRTAIVRVLATIPEITYFGKTTDLAGRRGLGFSVTADGSTSRLVIDTGSGDILAAQERVIGTVAHL
ncbi:hypothetical protein ACQPWW_13715 [Micromonospora sp. CA-240977]|uniref:hypothetical protein n=1 Tax=Micromonospora sp. CA-240977 TaxID=3239957 RepID=UPI003D913845